jgi:hypothetical protein
VSVTPLLKLKTNITEEGQNICYSLIKKLEVGVECLGVNGALTNLLLSMLDHFFVHQSLS